MEPYMSQISMFGFNFAPQNWAFCDGQLLPINSNQALYALIGTNFGGDGRSTMGLPGLQGRVPVHLGGTATPYMGASGGYENVPLNASTMPTHDHAVNAVTVSDTSTNTNEPDGKMLATSPASKEFYNTLNSATMTAMSTDAVSHTGGGQAHNNMQPSLVLNFCMALQGLFPSRN